MINKCLFIRNNKSNLDLITHNKSGFIFKNNQEFNILLNKNIDNIIENAYNYVLKIIMKKMKNLYQKLLNS